MSYQLDPTTGDTLDNNTFYEDFTPETHMNYEPIEEHHNKRTLFRPQTTDDTTPCIELAGIQVYTYLHRGELRISIHYDTAEQFLLDENDTIPTEISVGGTIVYKSHHNNTTTEPEQT